MTAKQQKKERVFYLCGEMNMSYVKIANYSFELNGVNSF